MAQKSNNNILIIVLLVLTFPLWIGLAGGLIGILAGAFGLLIGLVAGLFGIIAGIFGAIVGIFLWPFDWDNHLITYDFHSIIFLLLFVSFILALGFRSLKNKRAKT